LPGADILLADLGVSSMQLDDPTRGFSMKYSGPLDMRMNNRRGETASGFLKKLGREALARLLVENADEPHALRLAERLASHDFKTTWDLAAAVRAALPACSKEDRDLSVRRVFQAIRIAVNDEFSGLDNFLRVLPGCLNPNGRAAILTFHSGEDRRVKKAFQDGLRTGAYCAVAREVLRPSPAERHSNPRSASAKLRWAIRNTG
jgi:16S rRNA (cytosine1402-N4)-methyltransferase